MEEKDKIDTEEVLEEQESAEEQTDAAEEKKEEAPAEDKTAELEVKLKDREDKYLRLYAEFDNYKKRTEREKDARYADALIDTAAEFLPVLDNLKRAMETEVTSEDAIGVKSGVELIIKQMSEVLTKLKITEIKALGEEFDPNLHNAVMHTEDETVTENTVVEEFIKGYIYNEERVVRHSMVKVAN